MGHKVNPLAQRIGFIKNWSSLWFTHKDKFAQFIIEDTKIRKLIKERFTQAAIAKVVIERLSDKIRLRIFSARPGVVIGRQGKDIERLRSDLSDVTKKEIAIDIAEVNEPNLEAQLIAENVAFQLERRVAFRRAMKRSIDQAMSSGAKGIKISCAGRLGGAEMSRRETYKQGKIPLQTFRSDIDYGFTAAHTTYGYIGVKVWLYKGDIMPKINTKAEEGKESQEEAVPDGLSA